MAAQRIISLLPSATEMVYALGLGDRLVGVTHECDYQREVRSKPVVVRNALPIETMSQREIDAAVSERLRQGLSLYEIDATLVDELAPDLVITQSLCDVCAPSDHEMARLLSLLTKKPEVLWMTPRTLGEVAGNILDLGRAANREAAAGDLVDEGEARIRRIADTARSLAHRPRVFCMEWLDPVYCSGHWIPEMVRIAGGADGLGREGAESVRVPWEDVLRWAPEVLIFMPCGYDLRKAVEQSHALAALPGFAELPAVRNASVFAVDANDYFARPGPRLVEGTELMAHLIHPETFAWHGPPDAYRRLTVCTPPAIRSGVTALSGY